MAHISASERLVSPVNGTLCMHERPPLQFGTSHGGGGGGAAHMDSGLTVWSADGV